MSKSGFAEAKQARFAAPEMPVFEYVALGQAGRFVIPAAMRAAMGVTEGDRIMVALEGNVVKLESQKSVLRRIQAECKAFAIPGTSVVDELIADRRREAAQEDADAAPARGKRDGRS